MSGMELILVIAGIIVAVIVLKAVFKVALVVAIILGACILLGGVTMSEILGKGEEIVNKGKAQACPQTSVQDLKIAKAELIKVRQALKTPNLTPERKRLLSARAAKLDGEILRLSACR